MLVLEHLFASKSNYFIVSSKNPPIYLINPYLNTFFSNRPQETYIIYKFANEDLYGCLLKVCLCGYIRPEMNFDSLDALVAGIKADIAFANRVLDTGEHDATKDSDFFRKSDDAKRVES